MVEIESNVLDLLKCSECQNYLSCTPILVKENGESICGRCSSNTKSFRNKAYEDLATTHVFPCRFKEDGCTTKLTLPEVGNHEESCQYEKISCLTVPAEDCNWRGVKSELQQHFREKHNDLMINLPYIFQHDFTKHTEKNLLTSTWGFLFLFQIKCSLTTNEIQHSIRLIEPAKIASQFKYYLKITTNKISLDYNDLVDDLSMDVAKNTVVLNIQLLENLFKSYKDLSLRLTIERHEIKCMMCSENITDTRTNVTKEYARLCDNCNPAENGIIQCKSHMNGCTYKTTKNNLKKHEQWFCKFAVNKCPICDKDCTTPESRIYHLMNKCNNTIIRELDTPNLQFLITTAESKIYKIDVFGKEFFCVFTNKKKKLTVIVVTESLKEELENFTMEVTVENELNRLSKKLKLLDDANSDWKEIVNIKSDTVHVKFMIKKSNK